MPKRYPLRPPQPRLSLAGWAEADRLFHVRRSAMVPVREPLVLISQIQRSGGTLLNSLLDGHPQLHVHPWEIQVGHPEKYVWPRLDPTAGVDAWFEILDQPWLSRVYPSGYRKDRNGGPHAEDALPLTIVPSFVESLFRILVAEDPPQTGRQILDRYFTALFNAWIDYQGLWGSPKRWVAGFCPRLGWGESRGRIWSDYPEGRLVAVLRDPRAWFASARNHDERYSSLDAGIAEWRLGAEEIAAAKREAPDRVFVLTYEGLISQPEPVMRALAEWLEIDWAPSLLHPSFNRHSVPPNSSFAMADNGISDESLNRWSTELDAGERSIIEKRDLPLYEEVRESSAWDSIRLPDRSQSELPFAAASSRGSASLQAG